MKSHRRPWFRAGLLGPVPLLLPFAWALEVDSCGGTPTEEVQTGLSLLARLELTDWLIIAPVLLVVVLAPFVAHAFARPLFAWLTHLVGLVATGLSAWGVWLLLSFSIFTTRSPRGAGWMVVGLFAFACVDALLRMVWSTQEWLGAARAPRPGDRATER